MYKGNFIVDYMDLKNKRETELRCQIRINRKNKLLLKRVKIGYLFMALFLFFVFLMYIIGSITDNKYLLIGFAALSVIMLFAWVIYGLMKVCCPHCNYQRIRYGMGGKCCPSCGKTLIYSTEIEKIDIEMQEKGEGVPFE